MAKDLWKIALDELWMIPIVSNSPASQGVRVIKTNMGNIPERLWNSAVSDNPHIAHTETWYFKSSSPGSRLVTVGRGPVGRRTRVNRVSSRPARPAVAGAGLSRQVRGHPLTRSGRPPAGEGSAAGGTIDPSRRLAIRTAVPADPHLEAGGRDGPPVGVRPAVVLVSWKCASG
jgi:hypothetical protein